MTGGNSKILGRGGTSLQSSLETETGTEVRGEVDLLGNLANIGGFI